MHELGDLYQEIILDHYRNPRNRGELEVPPALRVEGFNPLCGDEIDLQLRVDGEVRALSVRLGGRARTIFSRYPQVRAAVWAAAVELA